MAEAASDLEEACRKLAPAAWGLDWRSDFARGVSDWECVLGDRRFHLHKVILAADQRGSDFFKAAFNKEYGTRSTNLTEVVPPPCHSHLESAIDFMYGKSLTTGKLEDIAALCKIGDVLQIKALAKSTTAVIAQLNNSKTSFAKLLTVGIELQLPELVMDLIVEKSSSRDLLGAVRNCFGGHPLEAIGTKMVDTVAWKSALVAVKNTSGVATSCNTAGGVDVKFHEKQVLKILDPSTATSCSLRIQNFAGHGPTIGVSRRDADVSTSGTGGFATRPGGWGLRLPDGALWTNGRRADLPAIGRVAPGSVIQMVLQDKKLCFFQGNEECTKLAEIPLGAEDVGPLVFTVCACGGGASYNILSLQ